jgi:hypothetical protein
VKSRFGELDQFECRRGRAAFSRLRLVSSIGMQREFDYFKRARRRIASATRIARVTV